MSAKLLCCNISVFTFVINMYLIGRCLETADFLFLTILSPPNFNIHQWILPKTDVAMMFANWWCFISIIVSTFINWHSTIISVSCPLFIQLSIHINIDSWVFYSMGYIIHYYCFLTLLLKLSQIQPLGAPSVWILCLLDMFPSFFFFENFLTCWHYKVF